MEEKTLSKKSRIVRFAFWGVNLDDAQSVTKCILISRCLTNILAILVFGFMALVVTSFLVYLHWRAIVGFWNPEYRLITEQLLGFYIFISLMLFLRQFIISYFSREKSSQRKNSSKPIINSLKKCKNKICKPIKLKD